MTLSTASALSQRTFCALFGLVCAAPLLFTACHPEDRSGEQPFPPQGVAPATVEIVGNICHLTASVQSSPNSVLRQVGFNYGNDTLRLETVAEGVASLFTADTEELLPGRYFVVAYARNGVGTTRADTVWINMP